MHTGAHRQMNSLTFARCTDSIGIRIQRRAMIVKKMKVFYPLKGICVKQQKSLLWLNTNSS